MQWEKEIKQSFGHISLLEELFMLLKDGLLYPIISVACRRTLYQTLLTYVFSPSWLQYSCGRQDCHAEIHNCFQRCCVVGDHS